jgi:cytochrome c oxidase assembly factor CtaG
MTLAAALSSWQIPPWPTAALLLTALLYWRGWRLLRTQMAERFDRWRLAAFLAGLAAIWLALASPLDAFAAWLLQAHMLQHILLTMIAPPLIWLGAPATPLLRGLPDRLAVSGVGPFLAWPALQRAARAAVHPVVAGLGFALAIAVWHLPGPYQLALRAPGWHEVEHLTFVGTALLFWFPVVQPWPSTAQWPRWTMVPYLLLADIENTILAALLAFSDRLIYPAYAAAPRLANLSALGDQAGAGAMMWVVGSAAFLIPAVVIVRELLEPGLARAREAERMGRRRNPSTWLGTGGALHVLRHPTADTRRPSFDLLTVPLLGRFLRWPYARRTVQVLMLALAAAVVADGLLGPQMGPMNLAGVLPWTYWRGAVVVALLAAGNLFCFACPFMLPREAGKRLFGARRVWPVWLRSKWLAVALLLLYLWAYEAFDLWDSPWWTATIILAYFAAAFAVDALFRGASFCKYVCPIGQFHFVHALVSPLEVRVREPRRCASCATHDCLRGRDDRRGCELDLFLPEKRGGLDCTLCLDCVHACPHDNVGILRSRFVRDLATDPHRSSLRRLSERPDVAALALLCVFGAFANAAGMLAPVLAAERGLADRLGIASTVPLVSAWLALALVVLPATAAIAAADLGRRLAASPTSRWRLAARFAFALLPLGLAMWAAHFLFHMLSGIGSAWPVVQRVARDLGGGRIGEPAWAAAMAPATTPGGLTALSLLLLDGGLLLSLYAAWQVARADTRARRPLGLLAPWAALAVGLYVVGAWIAFQPMDMRGMVH